MTEEYDFEILEEKWRPVWQAIDLYKTGQDPDQPNYYILDYFPYPSGDGLSVGHCRNYVPTCVAARFKRMLGPGDTLRCEVTLDERVGPARYLTARLSCGGKSVLRVQFVVAVTAAEAPASGGA